MTDAIDYYISDTLYRTTVDITKKDGRLTFVFEAENSQYFCPRSGYNEIHSVGDACEILIGSDPERGYITR